MILALIIFLLFDILSMRMETGFFPFNKGALSTYGPYTLIRAILIMVVYYLTASNVGVFGTDLPESLVEQWPLVVSITIPFLYLAVFKVIGGFVIKGVDVAAPIEGYLLKIRMEVAKHGMNAAIAKVYATACKASPAAPLTHIKTCFCNNMSNLLNMAIADCLSEFDRSQSQTEAQCTQSGITGANKDKLVISGWLSLVRKLAQKANADDSTHLSILQICS